MGESWTANLVSPALPKHSLRSWSGSASFFIGFHPATAYQESDVSVKSRTGGKLPSQQQHLINNVCIINANNPSARALAAHLKPVAAEAPSQVPLKPSSFQSKPQTRVSRGETSNHQHHSLLRARAQQVSM